MMEECFEYLDDLRENGIVNMFGAGPFLEEAFALDRAEANRVLGLWMRSFDRSKSAAERAAVVMEATP